MKRLQIRYSHNGIIYINTYDYDKIFYNWTQYGLFTISERQGGALLAAYGPQFFVKAEVVDE